MEIEIRESQKEWSALTSCLILYLLLVPSSFFSYSLATDSFTFAGKVLNIFTKNHDTLQQATKNTV
jgi:hypothetical protein